MPRTFKKYTSSFIGMPGKFRSSEHRRGQLPSFRIKPPSSELDTKPDTKLSGKLSFRKHLVQPHFDERVAYEDRRRTDARFRLYWRKSGLVKTEPVSHSRAEGTDSGMMEKLHSQRTEPSPRLRFHGVREPGEKSTKGQSRTSEWLSRFVSQGTVVPRNLSEAKFPAGHVAEPTPQIPRKRRTNEDKANVEAVLITPVPSLGQYLSAEMIDMIRTSPFYYPDGDVVVVRTHKHRTRGQNKLGCYKFLTVLIRNVANEIVYREQRLAAEEKMYMEEGAYDDPETVILSPAESKAMAWNLKRPFTRQLRTLRKKEKKKELSLKVVLNERDKGRGRGALYREHKSQSG